MMHYKKMIIAASALLAGCCINASAQETAPPNVLLIAIDDLNDWIGCMGGHPQATAKAAPAPAVGVKI